MFRIANVTRAPKALWLSASLLLVLAGASAASAQTSSFTYQGRLTDGGTPANGNYDLQFALWDSNSGGTQIGVTQIPNVAVSAGIFTVQLDFGATAFPGAPRFLEISARLTGSGSFTTLSPRQPITSTPYAIRSLNASSADTVTVGGVPSGSGNYIQNNPASQQAGGFNISGNGTAGGTLSANIVNATTQYNIGGVQLVRADGDNNLFVGLNSGNSNNTVGNSFFGTPTGKGNNGDFNSFFGQFAGISNTTGRLNTMMHPISFAWKANGTRDLGLGAEDVAKVEPLLVTHNDKGEIEGVKYDRLNVVLINAIKQQQEQIETLRAQNAALNARLRSVERIVRKKVGSAWRRR
jgi:hypothetical protein